MFMYIKRGIEMRLTNEFGNYSELIFDDNKNLFSKRTQSIRDY